MLFVPRATRRSGHHLREVLSHASGNREEKEHTEPGVFERREQQARRKVRQRIRLFHVERRARFSGVWTCRSGAWRLRGGGRARRGQNIFPGATRPGFAWSCGCRQEDRRWEERG